MSSSSSRARKMIVRLQKTEVPANDDSFLPHTPSAESSMIAEHANVSSLTPAAEPDRRLRNRLLVANIVAWIVIILAIRLIFF